MNEGRDTASALPQERLVGVKKHYYPHLGGATPTYPLGSPALDLAGAPGQIRPRRKTA